MDTIRLVTGDRNFSASSLRAWLLLKQFGIDFEEIRIPLFRPDTIEKLALYSPSLKVPVLLHGEVKAWDSLAVCEYVSETFLEGRGWPWSTVKRAAARSISAELHSGFPRFNRDWPMNCRAHMKLRTDERLDEEIARLDAIASCCRHKYGANGDWLFGNFSIADCLYAPYAVALRGYGALLTARASEYVDTVLANEHVAWWLEQAQEEREEISLEMAG